MIHYALRCGTGHEFDGWFPSITGFESQVGAGQIACPQCGGTRITRALMAPALARGLAADQAAAIPAPTPMPAPGAVSAAPPAPSLPAALVARLQRVRAMVEAHAEDVGIKFAETARAMHEGELPTRPIYGEVTAAEAKSLAEDDIPVLTLPWLPRADG